MPDNRDRTPTERPVGREFLIRGAGSAVLLCLLHGAKTENQMRAHIAYTSLVKAVTDLSEAGWIERVEWRTHPPSARVRAPTPIMAWRLTAVGEQVASSLADTGDLMDRCDPKGTQIPPDR